MSAEDDQKKADWETFKAKKNWTPLVKSNAATETARNIADWFAWLFRPAV